MNSSFLTHWFRDTEETEYIIINSIKKKLQLSEETLSETIYRAILL